MNSTILVHMARYFKKHKYYPSYTDIMDAVGVNQKKVLFDQVDELVQAGYIAKDKSGRRSGLTTKGFKAAGYIMRIEQIANNTPTE